MDTAEGRSMIGRMFQLGVAAVEPERLTADALSGTADSASLVAIGKAAAGMCRGAARVMTDIDGLCVAGDRTETVPADIEVMVGDHPIPGDSSFAAGHRALEVAASARHRLVALISGGGSALCELPLEGIPHEFIRDVHTRLLEAGASIEETNLVRRHLSSVKNGGLTRVANVPVDTYVISDVCGADISVVASGPTMGRRRDPEGAIAVMARYGIEVPGPIRRIVTTWQDRLAAVSSVTLLADGHTATGAIARAATAYGLDAVELDSWLTGDVHSALDRFFAEAGPGITVSAGEPTVTVTGEGSGGRSTHAALLAARRLAGTGAIFGAFATDGIDGKTRSAGAIVDGKTTERGGDPVPALETFDSAAYLERSGDLVVTGPTGTNVADIWILLR